MTPALFLLARKYSGSGEAVSQTSRRCRLSNGGPGASCWPCRPGERAKICSLKSSLVEAAVCWTSPYNFFEVNRRDLAPCVDPNRASLYP